LWQEQWDEKHWMPALCEPREGSVVGCMMQQSIAEAERAADVNAHLARDKAASLKPPPPKIPDGARASAPQAARVAGRSPKVAAFVARNDPLDHFVRLRRTAPHSRGIRNCPFRS
jgi:hypothetical protein